MSHQWGKDGEWGEVSSRPSLPLEPGMAAACHKMTMAAALSLQERHFLWGQFLFNCEDKTQLYWDKNHLNPPKPAQVLSSSCFLKFLKTTPAKHHLTYHALGNALAQDIMFPLLSPNFSTVPKGWWCPFSGSFVLWTSPSFPLLNSLFLPMQIFKIFISILWSTQAQSLDNLYQYPLG